MTSIDWLLFLTLLAVYALWATERWLYWRLIARQRQETIERHPLPGRIRLASGESITLKISSEPPSQNVSVE